MKTSNIKTFPQLTTAYETANRPEDYDRIVQELEKHPKNSFVKNIGHDGAGENCVESSYYDVEISENYPVIFTHTIVENINARKSFKRFFDNFSTFTFSF